MPRTNVDEHLDELWQKPGFRKEYHELVRSELAELRRQNELLKKHKSLSNVDWADTDLDYRLAMCAAMSATIIDALESFTDGDKAFASYFPHVIPQLIYDAKRDRDWFDTASSRVSGCGTADRPSGNLEQRLADNLKRVENLT